MWSFICWNVQALPNKDGWWLSSWTIANSESPPNALTCLRFLRSASLYDDKWGISICYLFILYMEVVIPPQVQQRSWRLEGVPMSKPTSTWQMIDTLSVTPLLSFFFFLMIGCSGFPKITLDVQDGGFERFRPMYYSQSQQLRRPSSIIKSDSLF